MCWNTTANFLCVDCGFACYKEEMLRLLEGLFPRFSLRGKEVWLTHADVDHAGLLSLFDRACMSRDCYENFALEQRGKANFREQNPLHAPYCALSKVISGYVPPDMERCVAVGEKRDDAPLSCIGLAFFRAVEVRFLSGSGGHVRGETVIVCDKIAIALQRRHLRQHQGLFP